MYNVEQKEHDCSNYPQSCQCRHCYVHFHRYYHLLLSHIGRISRYMSTCYCIENHTLVLCLHIKVCIRKLFSLFLIQSYVVGTKKYRLSMVLLSTRNTCLNWWVGKYNVLHKEQNCTSFPQSCKCWHCYMQFHRYNHLLLSYIGAISRYIATCYYLKDLAWVLKCL